jgi:hypothetical protein
MPAKNVIFAAGPLAPYPDMALALNRCEIIKLLHPKLEKVQKNTFWRT